MTIFCRHLLLGLCSWVSGRAAAYYALHWPEPVFEYVSNWPQLTMTRLSDWSTLVFFRPYALLFAGLCLLLSLWLSFHIAAVHARQLWRKRTMPAQDQLLHIVLLLFALVLLLFLWLKFAWAVCLVLLGWKLEGFLRWHRQQTLRRRLLRAEWNKET